MKKIIYALLLLAIITTKAEIPVVTLVDGPYVGKQAEIEGTTQDFYGVPVVMWSSKGFIVPVLFGICLYKKETAFWYCIYS